MIIAEFFLPLAGLFAFMLNTLAYSKIQGFSE